MKNNLVYNYKEFKLNVKELRKELDLARSNGYIGKDFYNKLEILKKEQINILNFLIPYYREYEDTLNIQISEINQIGSFKLDTYLSSYLILDEEYIILNKNNKETNISYINNDEIEILKNISGIDQTIIYSDIIDKKKYIFLTKIGSIYILNEGKLSIYNINISYILNATKVDKERILIIDDNYKLFLLTLNKQNYNLSKLEILSKNIKLIEKIDINNYILVTEDNRIDEYNLKNRESKSIKQINTNINKIKSLIDSNMKKSDVLFLADDGLVEIYSLTENLFYKIYLEGNLFEIESILGVSIVLSDNSKIYFLEENLGRWKLNEKNIIDNMKNIVLNVIPYNQSFLIIDIMGNIKRISINRLRSYQELLQYSLY